MNKSGTKIIKDHICYAAKWGTANCVRDKIYRKCSKLCGAFIIITLEKKSGETNPIKNSQR